MKILVFSDSHGKVEPIPYLLDNYKGEVETVVHLGDNVDDLLQLQSDYSDINFVAVAGNCDFGTRAPRERILVFGSKKILLMHGHSHGVKSQYDRLMYYALEKEVDACLFGHSHFPIVFRHESVFFMNPGSLSEPRGNKAGYGLLCIDSNGNITGRLIEL